jgi:hypothetical protein
VSDERHQKVDVTPQEVERLAVALEALVDSGWGAPQAWGPEELAAIVAATRALRRIEEVLRSTLGDRQHVKQFLAELEP